jgi:ATP-binding cassette subfamily B protein
VRTIIQRAEIMKRLRHVQRALGLVREAAGGWAAAWLLLIVVQGAIPGGIVYMTKWVVDAAEAAVGQGVSWEQVSTVLVPASIMGGLLLAQRMMGSLMQYVNTAQSELVGDHMKALIHDKAASVEYGFYESDAYYDLLEQANSQASSRTLGLLQNLGGLLSGAITFITIAGLLLQYSLWLPLVLVVSTAPAFWVLLRHNRKHHAWWDETTSERRRTKYYDIMLTKREAAAEVRLNDLGGHFRTIYQAIRKRLRDERLDLLRQQTLARLAAGLIALLATGGAMAWIAWRAFLGLARLGDIALFYQAFNQGQGIVRKVLNNLGEIYTNTLFLEHFFELIDHPLRREPSADPQRFPSPLEDGVRFEGVTFTYPGADRPALKDFDLHIPAGQITSIVGENGAGKSTVVKLICRLYEPQEGRILVDGTDIQNIPDRELRRHLSVMFQFPMRYQLTAYENIALGDLSRGHVERLEQERSSLDDWAPPGEASSGEAPSPQEPSSLEPSSLEPSSKERSREDDLREDGHYKDGVRDGGHHEGRAREDGLDRQRVREAAKGAGAHSFISELSGQYDAMLGRLFTGGNELSGGEWQRVALARAYYREAPVLILDEPTSHMDSWNETEWLQRFKALARTRTALIITHRFTTAMHADRILVMDDGTVVESGTHDDLVAQGGRYASSWKAQMDDSGVTDRGSAKGTGSEKRGTEDRGTEDGRTNGDRPDDGLTGSGAPDNGIAVSSS